MLNLTLHKYVADVLLHRLEVIREASYLRELFEEQEELDLSLLEESANNYYDALSSGSLSVGVTTAEDLEILIDCLEGCTYFGNPTHSAKENNRKKAVRLFTEQLSTAIKRPIQVCLI